MKLNFSLRCYCAALLCLAVLGTMWPNPTFADCELAKLLASDGAGSDKFGVSVSISGSTAVIGSYSDDDNGSNSGSAYIFRFDGSTWVEEQKLLASDGAAYDVFGCSVSISGDAVVIGAYGDDDNGSESGSAYIFRFDGSSWIEEQKLLALDGAADDEFARNSVSIFGDTVIIGAYLDDENGTESGSAYIFRFDGSSWVPEMKLLASDGAAADEFGFSVDISGDTAVIGARRDDDSGGDSGSAYIFRFDGLLSWIEEAKLTASDGAANDLFGCHVGISGDTAVIGASHDDDKGLDSGSAYIFRFDGSSWPQEDKLTASDGAADDRFGCSVDISGDTAIIGAHFDDDSGNETGSAYIFRYNGSSWGQQNKLLASDSAAEDRFGVSVSISGDTGVIGAFYDDNENGSDSGSAYIFGFNGVTWEEELLASGGENYDGFGNSADIWGGTVVIGAPDDEPNGAAYIFRFDDSSWTEEAKLLASDGDFTDWFGSSAAIFGDTVVIGAPTSGYAYTVGSAYIFRYNGSNWIEEDKLLAFDGEPNDFFGYPIGISGDTVVIGAPGDNDNGYDSGSAYIFRFDGSSWVVEDKLLASDGDVNDFFGESVGISGDTVVIGAAGDSDFTGSAYIFRFDGVVWVEEAKLTASDGTVEDGFGISVGISGDTVVIGAIGDEYGIGSAYIFRFDGSNWVEEAKLFPSDGGIYYEFGFHVDIFGNTVAIGAIHDNYPSYNYNLGSAYIFRFDGSSWVQEDKLLVPWVDEDYFSYNQRSVGIWGDTAVIGGAFQDNATFIDIKGSAYVFGLSLNPGDLDFDNDVDFYDYCLFAIHWLVPDCGPCNCDRADFTGDGQVDNYDLKVFCDNWLQGK